MKHFIVYMLLLVFASILKISQSSDGCFYSPNHEGRKCYNSDHSKYKCCLPDYQCKDGQCYPPDSPKSSSFETIAIIGIVVAVVFLACLIIGAIYWHRTQTNSAKQSWKFLSPFFRSGQAPSSVGVRLNSSKMSPSSVETSASVELNTISQA